MIRLTTVLFVFITLPFFVVVQFMFVVAANDMFANTFLATVALLIIRMLPQPKAARL